MCWNQSSDLGTSATRPSNHSQGNDAVSQAVNNACASAQPSPQERHETSLGVN